MTEGHQLILSSDTRVRVIRGLSAVFWGMPLSLLICVRSAATDWLRPYDVLYSVAALALVGFGTWQLSWLHEIKDPRWSRHLERSKVFAVINVGLSPFILFWNRYPQHFFFNWMISLLAVGGLLYLFFFNQTLRRMVSIFNDRLLQSEITFFSYMNSISLSVLMACTVVYIATRRLAIGDPYLSAIGNPFLPIGQYALLILVLLPLSLTMTITWKVKEEFLRQT